MTPPPDRAELEAWLQGALARHSVPGLAATLALAGGEETVTLGVISLEDPLPVTPRTLFRWGSITKTVTCLATLRLVERGGLTLDEPVRRHLPELRLADEEAARSLTLRHLLTHSGGWFDDDRLPDTGPGDDALALALEALAERPQLLPPGRASSYGDWHFLIAGRLVEVLSGLSFERATRELVLEPLGLTESFFDLAEVVTRRVAAGYARPRAGGEASVVRPWPNPRNRAPSSGLTGTLTDLVRYARFLMGDGRSEAGEQFFSNETMLLMRSPLMQAAFDHWRGLSWNVRDLAGVHFVGHGGTAPGYHAQMQVAPERDFLLCILVNSSDGLALTTEFVDWARKRYLGVVKDKARPRELPDEALAEYAGHYQGVGGNWGLEVRPHGGNLQFEFVDSDGSRDVNAVGLCPGDVFVGLDGWAKGRRGEFLRDDAGRVRWIRFFGRIGLVRA